MSTTAAGHRFFNRLVQYVDFGTVDLSTLKDMDQEFPRMILSRVGSEGNAGDLEIYALECAPTLKNIVKPGVFPRQ